MALLKKDPIQLRKLLLYHMVGGNLRTSAMIKDQLAPSLDGVNNLRLQVYHKVGNKILYFIRF